MKYNLIVFVILLFFSYLLLEALNFFVAGYPSFKHPRIRLTITDLVSYKYDATKEYTYNDFLRVYSEEYANLNYSGKIKKIGCGPLESGKYNLIFKTDKYGFRENKDIRYSYSDIVLLGDSFTMSNCINKPYDLKSVLTNLDKKNSYLNLGIHGTQPWQQLALTKKILANTEFKKLIWIFTEANDYENPRDRNFDTYNKMLTDENILNENIKKTINLWSAFLNEPVKEEDYLVEKKYLAEISLLTYLKILFINKTRGLSTLAKYFKEYPDLLNKESYEKTVRDMHDFAKRKNIKVYLYYIPSYIRLSYKGFDNHPQIIQLNNLKNEVKKITEKNNFTFIDGEESFNNLKNKLKVYHHELPTHYNEFGYRLMSEMIISSIK